MNIKMCDKCKKVTTEENPVASTLNVTYWIKWKILSDRFDDRFETRVEKERFDLCETCVQEFYKSIKGHYFATEGISREAEEEWEE